MKFVVRAVRTGQSRLGTITEAGIQGGKTIETPACMLYTKGGSAPHLTTDMLEKIQRLPPFVHMPLPSLLESHESIQEYGKGIGNFTAMQDYLVYSSLHDSAVEVPPNYNDKFGVAVWTKCGKMKLDVDAFMRVQDALRPDWYQALCDGDTTSQSSRKRTMKAVNRTLEFLDEIIKQHEKNDRLNGVEIFGVIQGGYLKEERKRSANETKTRNVAGFVLDGFHNYGPKTEEFHLSEIKDLLRETIECLPDDKPRIMHSIWSPDKVLEGIENGIDIFDSAYPYIVTSRKGALCFDFHHHEMHKPPHPEELGERSPHATAYEMHLSDKKYCEDFSPILPECSCYACQNFTRAYVHHLIATSEMLADVLLMLHNFHHYFEYFAAIRTSLQEDTYESLKQHILQQKKDDS